MTTLLPIATYTTAGSGAVIDLGTFRALRGSVDVTDFAGAAATFSLETSRDGMAWRPAGAWEPFTEVGQGVRAFAGLARYVRVAYDVPGSLEVQVEAELVQIYATVADFNTSGLSIAALDGVPAWKIVTFLEDASRTIDSYLSGRVGLPLILFGSSLRRAAILIAVYDLLSHIGYNPEGDNRNYRQRYLDIIAWLVDIRDNGAPLPDGLEDSTPSTSEGAPDVDSDPLRGW